MWLAGDTERGESCRDLEAGPPGPGTFESFKVRTICCNPGRRAGIPARTHLPPDRALSTSRGSAGFRGPRQHGLSEVSGCYGARRMLARIRDRYAGPVGRRHNAARAEVGFGLRRGLLTVHAVEATAAR